jgi:hypothetical protein
MLHHKISEEGIPIVFVDEMGNEHLKTMIFSTEEKIDVSKLKTGVYKIVVTYERETFFTSIIKN